MKSTRPLLTALCSLALLCLALPVRAGELVYTPVNPTFGGNPLNASGLQANAQAQNDFKAPIVRPTPLTALEKFSDSLQNAVLSRLSSTALGSLFDADGKILPGRTVTAGNYSIAITEENGNLVLTTSDKSVPGASTRIVVGNVSTAELPLQ